MAGFQVTLYGRFWVTPEVQAIRQRNDHLSFEAVDPHFTLFFPCDEVVQKDLVHTAKQNIKGFNAFKFVLRSAVLMPPVTDDYWYTFLVPDEGFSQLVKLHDQIYRGSLAKSLRPDILFVPHVTVASTKSPEHGKKLVDDLNSQNIEVRGTIVRLTVVVEDGGRIKTIEDIALD
jgi:2'-5' RNA ligase